MRHLNVPEGSADADHLGARITFGRIMVSPPSDREWYITLRVGKRRFLWAIYRHQGRLIFRRNWWYIGPDHGANWIATDGCP